MSRLYQCDRCGKQSPTGSLSANDFRIVSISNERTGGSARTKDLCKDCILTLEDWWSHD